MVEIIAGSGTGFEKTSAYLLGAAGTLGSGAMGTAGQTVAVNADTGNLVIQSEGDTLDGVGLDATVGQTYNSLGLLNTANSTNWAAQGAQIVNMVGSYGAANSTVQRIGWDGSLVTYTYNASFINANGSTGAYVAKESAGADDSLTYSGTTWSWHQGSTGVIETYTGGNDFVATRTDTSGNTLTFTYYGTTLNNIATSDGEHIWFSYSGGNVTSIVTTYTDGQTNAAGKVTRTYYTYDSQNRLTSVTTDLTPTDNSISDNNVYTTTYAYQGSTNLIASITQSDGSKLTFTYDAQNRVASYTESVAGSTTRTTTLSYGSGSTTVTDPLGNQAILSYNASGQLTAIAAPPAVPGGNSQISAFTYDGNGNVLTSATYDGAANQTAGTALTRTTNTYDGNGNLLSTVDLLGNTTTYTYNSFNSILTRTVYTAPAQGSTAASGAETTFYAYDANDRLQFVVSAAGDVTAYTYDAKGEKSAELVYTSVRFSTSGYSATNPISLATLVNWQAARSATDNESIERTDYLYDFRGNLASEITYSATDASGDGLLTSAYTQTNYVYDQAGNLLHTLVNTIGTTTTTNTVSNWWTQNLTATSTTLNGQSATQFTVQTGGSQAQASVTVPNNFTANANDTVTAEITLQALTAGESTGIGLIGYTSGWGDEGLASAKIVSGAGTLTQSWGGLWTITGLSTTSATTIEITREYTQTETVGFSIYADNSSAGNGVIVANAQVTHNQNAVKSATYDGLGRVLSQTDANGNTITTGYTNTSAGEQVATTNAIGSVNTMLYDLAGELTSSTTTGTGISATTTSYIYDNDGQLRVATDPAGVNTYYFYDNEGRKTGSVDGAGYVTEYRYDAASRLVATVAYANALSAAQLASLAPSGGAASATTLTAIQPVSNASDNWNWTVYDAASRAVETINAVGTVTTFTYDGTGAVTGQTIYANQLTSAQLATLIANTPGQNVLTNPGFNGMAGWSGWNGTGAILNSGSPYVGTWEGLNYIKAQFTATAAGQSASINSDPSPFAVSAGQTLNVEAGVEGAGPVGNLQLVVWWYNSSGARIGDTLVSIIGGAPAYNTILSGTATAPAGTVAGILELSMPTYAAGNGWFTLIEPKVSIANSTLAAVLPAANASQDRTTRNFYNADGLLIGALDAQGYLSEVDYDAAGRKIDTIRFATQVSSSLTASGTFAQLQASVWNPAQDQKTDFVYDNEDRLVLEVRGAESTSISATYYTYDALGHITETATMTGMNSGISSVFDSNYYLSANPDVQTVVNSGSIPSALYHYEVWGWYEGRWPSATLSPTQAYAQYGVFTNATRYTYDNDGNLLSETLGAGTSVAATTSYAYDAAGRQTSATDARGYTTTNTYDALGRVLQTSVQIDGNSSDNAVTAYSYDSRGNKVSETDPRGNVTYFYYDSDDRLVLEVDPDGYATATTYLAASTMVASVTHYAMPLGQIAQIMPDGFNLAAGQSVYSPDARFQLSYQTDGNLVLYASGTALWASNTGGTSPGHVGMQGDGNLVVYSAAGTALWASGTGGASGASLFITTDGRLSLYSASGTQIWSTTNTVSSPSSFYGTAKPPAQTTTTGDATTSFSYDAAYQLTGTADAMGYTQSYILDAFGDRTQAVNQLGGVTTYVYDRRGLLSSETLAETALTVSGGTIAVTNTYGYDAFGNRTWQTEASGAADSRTTTYNYDGLDRLISSSVSLGSQGTATTQYQYDGNGNVVMTTDPDGNKTYEYYDALNRKVAEVNAVGVLSTWTYDTDGNVLSARTYATPLTSWAVGTTPAGTGNYRETDYTYDGGGHLLSTTIDNVLVGWWNGSSYQTNGPTNIGSTNVYDQAGNLIKSIDGNNNSTYYYYDKSGNKIASVDGDGYLTTYILDQNGNVTQETQYATGIAASTTSSVSSLISAASNGTNANDRITTFTYDKDGSRLTETRLNVASATVSSTGVLTTATANATVSYTYNGIGEVLTKTEATGDKTTYTYDSQGRMETEVNAAGLTTAYYYDGLNNVTRTSASGANSATRVTTYSYGAGGRLASTTGPGVNSGEANQLTYFFYDLDGNLINQNEYMNGEPNTIDENFSTYFTYDGLNRVASTYSQYINGSTWTRNDTDGMVYDAFGDVVAQTVNGARTTQSIYDNSGHIIASNSGDGTWKAFVNDGDGNATLTIQTLGTTDLSSYLQTGASSNGIDTSTYNQVAAFAVATDGGASSAGTATGATLTTSSGSTTVSYTGHLWAGEAISGTGIPGGVTVTSVNASAGTATLSLAATASGSITAGVEVTIGVIDGDDHLIQTRQAQRTINGSGTAYTLSAETGYDAFGDVVSQEDARNYTTRFVYNTEGKLIEQVDPQVTVADGSLYVGQSISATGIPVGTKVTGINYNSGTGVITATLSSAATASGTININGTIATTVNGSASVTLAGAGSTALGNPTLYNYYDLSGRLVGTRDADGNLDTRTLLSGTGYDGSQAHETAEYHPDGGKTYYSYDGYGDALTQTDALGYVTTNTYDNSGNLIQVSDPSRTTNSDGSSGDGSELTDYYTYDVLGQRISEANSQIGSGTTETTTYDAQGRVISTTDYMGHTVNYIYTWNGAGASGGTTVGLYAYGGWTKETQDVSAGVFSFDTTDVFGHEIGKSDFGGLVYNFTYNKAGELIAQSNTAATQILQSGVTLTAGQSVYSPSQRYQLEYQGDGNFVLYGPAGALWASNTVSSNAGRAVMQADGNLVVYDTSNNVKWTSNTSGNSGASLSVTDNGELEILSTSGAILWHSTNVTGGTAGAGGENITYTYYSDGRVATIVDNAAATSGYYSTTLTSNFSYDADGNRLTSTYTSTCAYSGSIYGYSYSYSIVTNLENSTATYDALDRIASISDTGNGQSITTTNGSTNVSFTGDPLWVGEPVSGTGIPSGTKVTSVNAALGTAVLSNAATASGTVTVTTSTRPAYTQTTAYDANGNVIENRTVHQNISGSQALLTTTTTDDYWYAYDSMNRVVVSEGELSGTAGTSGVNVIAGTSGSLGDGNIQARTSQTAGTWTTYNVDGDEATSSTYATATSGTQVYAQETQQSYIYSADGYLVQVNVAQSSVSSPTTPGAAVKQGAYTRDAMGRVLRQDEFATSASDVSGVTVGQAFYSHTYAYNNDSQITGDNVSILEKNTSTGSIVNTATGNVYSYGTILTSGTYASGDYADGNVVSESTSTYTYSGTTIEPADGNNHPSTSTGIATTYTYDWFDGAEQAGISTTYSGSQTGTTTSTSYYDRNNHLTQVTTTGTGAHTNTYVESAAGLIMSNDELLTSGGTTAPETFYFYFNDKQIGQIGNNGTTNTSYSGGVTSQTTTGSGVFANGASSGASYANFDPNANVMSPTGNGSTNSNSSYTVQAGDTVSSIAEAVFGDANLWYLIADANGLSFNSGLTAGQTLTIPNAVVNVGNTSSTFKPYNANAALGDVQPGAPIPSSNSGCGGIGQILMAVVAIAVAVVVATVPVVGDALDTSFGGMLFGSGGLLGEAGTDIAVGAISGIAGNVASQGLGLAIGAQSSFNWGSLGMAAITGAVGGAVSTTGIFDNIFSSGALDDAAQSIVSSVASQGVEEAAGLQSRFDWAGVAAAGVGAGVSDVVGATLSESRLNGSMQGPVDISRGTSINIFVSGVAGDIANAATRTAINGTDFSNNLISALPDAIANTIGNAVASQVSGSQDSSQQGNPGNAPAPGQPGATAGGASSTAIDIQEGQTLNAIASAHGTTVAAILAVNPNITDANQIDAGASLNLPQGVGPLEGDATEIVVAPSHDQLRDMQYISIGEANYAARIAGGDVGSENGLIHQIATNNWVQNFQGQALRPIYNFEEGVVIGGGVFGAPVLFAAAGYEGSAIMVARSLGLKAAIGAGAEFGGNAITGSRNSISGYAGAIAASTLIAPSVSSWSGLSAKGLLLTGAASGGGGNLISQGVSFALDPATNLSPGQFAFATLGGAVGGGLAGPALNSGATVPLLFSKGSSVVEEAFFAPVTAAGVVGDVAQKYAVNQPVAQKIPGF